MHPPLLSAQPPQVGRAERRSVVRRWGPATVAVLLLLSAAGCTGSGRAGDPGGDNPGGNPDVITAEQVEQARSASSAYALVERLRPNWLRKHGRSSIQNPGAIYVYVEGTRYGTVQGLRSISVSNVASMTFLNAAEATTRFGSGHDHGVILVEQRSGS